MAGSRDWFVYTSDSGQNYLVNLDESNAEATGFPHFGVGTPKFPPAPKGLTMRYVFGRSRSVDARTRRFYVATVALLNNILTAGTVVAPPYPGSPNETWDITTYQGETRKNLAITSDTGLNDGDAEN